MWNRADPILKERLFGLNGTEGNHGEDVKEYYYFLIQPRRTVISRHSINIRSRRFRYPLIEENRKRTRLDPEFELIDTGIFDDDRYFDVFVEYAKFDPEDIAIRISIANRGPVAAALDMIPTLWFRNTWAWRKDASRPWMTNDTGTRGVTVVAAEHSLVGRRWLYADGDPSPIFCDNDTNTERLYGTPGPRFPKDAFNAFIVEGRADAVNPSATGTKAGLHYALDVGPGQTVSLRLRLSNKGDLRAL